jgi:hypothetical protein
MSEEKINELAKQIEQLQKLVKPKNESQTLENLFASLAKAQVEIEVANKDSANPFFKSHYADLTEIIRVSRPALTKNGLSVIQRVMGNGDGRNYLYTRLCHTSGEWIESCMSLVSKDQTMQAMGSAITYARRYAYASMVGVVAGDEDDDGNRASGKKSENPKNGEARITQAQAKDILEQIMEFGEEELMENVLRHYNINSLAYLPAPKYKDLMKNLEAKKQGMAHEIR